MSKRTIERRLQDYRTKSIPQELDDLLGDVEAEMYKLRRQAELLERKLAEATRPPAATTLGTATAAPPSTEA